VVNRENGFGRRVDGWSGLRLVALLLAVGLAGCTVLRLERPKVVDADDWLTEGDSPRRENRADVTLDPPLEEAWTVNAGAGFGPVSPLILGETVLAATRKGEVVAIRAADGKKLGTQGFGDVIEGSPVIADGALFVPVAWGKQTLRAYDLATAGDRWTRADLPPIEAGLLLLDDVLIAVDVESVAHAVDAKTGKERWAATLDERASVLATPVVSAAGHVIVADDRGRVVALRPEDGAPVWTRDLGAPVEVTPTTDGRTIFLATTRARLFALDAVQGAVRWVFEVPDPTVRLAAPALSGGDLVFGGSDGVLRAVDPATGAVRWTFEAPDAITAPPLITRSTVYVGTMGRMLYGVDRSTGAKRWEHRLKGRVKSPMAAREGILVVLTEPHEVYLFRPAKKALAAEK
jgi:outer membrane protein assembly factor BamB